eukprot:6345897-Alexandrium_andersonii.AAC.1
MPRARSVHELHLRAPTENTWRWSDCTKGTSRVHERLAIVADTPLRTLDICAMQMHALPHSRPPAGHTAHAP